VPAQLEEDPLSRTTTEEITAGRGSRTCRRLVAAAAQRGRGEAPLRPPRASVARDRLLVLRADAAGAAEDPPGNLPTSCRASPAPRSSPRSGKPLPRRRRRPPPSPFAALEGEGPRSGGDALRAWRAGGDRRSPSLRSWGRVRGDPRRVGRAVRGERIFPGRASASGLPPGTAARGWRSWHAARTGTSSGASFNLDPPRARRGPRLSPRSWGRSRTTSCAASAGRRGGQGVGGRPAAHEAPSPASRRENPIGLPASSGSLPGRGAGRRTLVAWERKREVAFPGWRVDRVGRAFSLPAASPLPALRGRVDRNRPRPAGEARVIDYKYRDPVRGRSPRLDPPRPLPQVPVYLAFAGSLSPSPSAVSAAFYFLRNEFGVEEAPGGTRSGGSGPPPSPPGSPSPTRGVPALPHHRFTTRDGRPPGIAIPAVPGSLPRLAVYDGSEIDPGALAARIARGAGAASGRDHRPGKGSRCGKTGKRRRTSSGATSPSTPPRERGRRPPGGAGTNLFLASRPSPDLRLLLTFTDKAARRDEGPGDGGGSGSSRRRRRPAPSTRSVGARRRGTPLSRPRGVYPTRLAGAGSRRWSMAWAASP